MQELITIHTSSINNELLNTVDARDLHTFLGVGRDFSTWIKDRIGEFGFVEGQDYSIITGSPILVSKKNNPRGGHNRLDYHVTLDMAKELDLPVIIHSRNAFDETIEILDRYDAGLKGVVFHCFGGSAEQAKLLLQRGYHVSFTGVVTFKNAQTAREAAQVVPLDRLMVETDCPYMSPEPMRKQKPNEPALMVHTARLLAQLKTMDLEEFARASTSTAQQFFDLA